MLRSKEKDTEKIKSIEIIRLNMLKDTKKERQDVLLNKELLFFVLIINYEEVFKEVFIKKFQEVLKILKKFWFFKEVFNFFGEV